jgi:hypothetical protein
MGRYQPPLNPVSQLRWGKASVQTAVQTSVQTVGRLQRVGPNKGGYWQVLE